MSNFPDKISAYFSGGRLPGVQVVGNGDPAIYRGRSAQLLLLSTDSNPERLASVVVVNWDRSNSS
jgi:hypothetical protein